MTLLGQSASASVFEIEHDGTLVICKRLVPRMLREEAARLALHEEAHALEVLGGRGAPRLIGFGDDERGPYLMMQRIPFTSLTERIGRCDRTFLDRAARSAFACLDAIHRASDERGPLGMLHADLSPSNLLVSESGHETWVIDFGLASWRDAPHEPGGAFRGTLAYAAPEVARGERFDARADLFALAASIAHVAVGAPLRTSTSSAALLAEAAEKAIDATALEGRFSPNILLFLRSCLAFDPKDRPRSVPPPEVEDGHGNDR